MDQNMTLEKRIAAELYSYQGRMSVFVDDLQGHTVERGAEEEFETASVIKAFLLAALYLRRGWLAQLGRSVGAYLGGLALATLPLGLGLGMLAATALLRHGLLHGVAKVYTTLLRGLPELLTLFIIYNGLSMLLNLLCRTNGVDGFVALSPFTAGMLALALVFGAYAAEVISGAYLALDKGPREAGMALGMPRWQILLLIEWPALIRLALPGLGNLWLNLVKDTALVSVIALASNLLLLVALLSLLQATLTLPGIAAIALTLGMAIDANVLINERIREELRLGHSPAMAIHNGYDHAFDTILDSNVTTLIAGIALLVFGSGPVRGFAVVHCLGILTSMFSAILVSRGLVNLIYGKKRKLEKLAIGQVWKPGL